MSFVYCMVNIKLFIILYNHLIYECLSYQLRPLCKIFSISLRPIKYVYISTKITC